MFKKTGCALALALVSSVAVAGVPAGTIGVGVSHGENVNTIFVPITLEGNLWVEPFVSYTSQDIKQAGVDTETTAISVGTGLFVNFYETAKTRAYFGGRIGYSYFENDPANGSSNDDSGFLIQPTLGFGYMPVDNIMFGAEAYVSYQNSDITGTETLGTGTALFARYYFAQ